MRISADNRQRGDMNHQNKDSVNQTGTIFSIKRFATHDGNGLRTTIFFKGCPLRCVWCQNPEGLETEPAPVYFSAKCIGCGACIRACVKGGMTAGAPGLQIHREKQENWAQIIYNCPTGAIAMDARTCTVQELIAEVEKDKVFYCIGSGGVTISGGEPLMQGDFAAELLAGLKERGIHTAIETSLFASAETLQKVLPYLDQIYADMKLADAGEHAVYTKVTNDPIKKNMEYLLTSPKKAQVIVRTPLIPGFTATEHNLTAIAEFLSGIYPEVHYELLNYNPLAEAKYHLVGREYCFKENPKLYTRAQMLEFGELVRAHGIKNLIIEVE